MGDEPFVMYLGDNLLKRGIARFVEEFDREKPAAQILLDARARSADVRRRGARRAAASCASSKSRRSRRAISRSSACTCSARQCSTRSSASSRASRNELEITDAIQDLIDRGLEVRPHIVEGWWKDTGKLEDMLEANRLILDTIERQIDGTVDAESRVEGKVIVAAAARRSSDPSSADRSSSAPARASQAPTSGPFTSIGDGVELRDTEIEHSIVLEGAKITDLANARSKTA